MNGLCVKSTGSWYTVLPDGETQNVECKVKGTFRLKGIRSTNPVSVGDHVSFDLDSEGHGLISEIDDRKNYIIRRSTNLSKKSQIIAANLDQALLIVTLKHPETSTVFIDRFLASAEAFGISVVIAFNKVDIYTPEDLQLLDAFINLYETIGYRCVTFSATKGANIDKVKQLLNGKVTLLSGNSGVGKSTFINAVEEKDIAVTKNISSSHDTGMHTTTFSEMYPLNHGGYIIDTPGIKGFGVIEMEKEEISHYFKEIFAESKHCKFSNCTHTHEPQCAVLKAISEHRISQSRYQSYLSILNEDMENKYR